MAMQEFALIEAIRRMVGPPEPPVRVGIGDDAAVLEGSSEPAVLTTDAQVEGVHFRLAWQPPRVLGARAVEITLSDLAAMGARPKALFVSMNIPARLGPRIALSLVRGISAAGKRRSCPLAGGNIAVYAGPLALTLTALGEIPPGREAYLRSAARPGEGIYVTGMPGLARLGLEALNRQRQRAGLLRSAVRRFLRPRARFDEIEFLSARARLGAVIDLSDGLAGDLGHVLEESRVGAEVKPVFTPSYLRACELVGISPEACFFGPSDDYELLFTARSESIDGLVTAFRKRFRRSLLLIGRICADRGLWLLTREGRRRRLAPRSYEHRFGPP